jgi:2-dehydropantoate 2-reductase
VRANGLQVQTPTERFQARVAAAQHPAELGPQDAVIVTVKAPALPSVAAAIAPLLGPDTPVAFVMNGIPWWYFHRHAGALEGRRLPCVDPDDQVWNAVTPARAIGGVVWSACTVIEPGVIQVANATSRVILGEPDGTASARIAAILAPLAAGGIQATENQDIRTALWTKLLGNLASGPLVVLARAAPREAFAEPAIAAAARTIIAEGLATAEALGCQVRPDIERQMAGLATMTHRPSVLQDLELGRPMEIAGIYEGALELARLAGVETPMLDLVTALARVRAREAGLY